MSSPAVMLAGCVSSPGGNATNDHLPLGNNEREVTANVNGQEQQSNRDDERPPAGWCIHTRHLRLAPIRSARMWGRTLGYWRRQFVNRKKERRSLDLPMNISRIAGLGILLLIGCGRERGVPASNEAQLEEVRSVTWEQQRAMESLTNVHPAPAEHAVPEAMVPEVSWSEESIELKNLGIVLRAVQFPQPINQRTRLYFGEAEITNEQYAAFLRQTSQTRDDTEIATGGGGSTASPVIGLSQPEMHWRGGKFPAGQDEFPVTLLTTSQATEFCRWLNAHYKLAGSFRLPSEKEWLAAAYGETRKYPWGDDERKWTGKSSERVRARPELRTPDGLYGMWGNVAELVLSASNGYGGEVPDFEDPMITKWLGTTFADQEIRGRRTQPRQDYWGYTHSRRSRSDTWGFRIVFVPE